MQMKDTCCVVETTGNRETHQYFSSFDKSPSNLPSSLIPPTLEMDPGKKKISPDAVRSHGALLCSIGLCCHISYCTTVLKYAEQLQPLSWFSEEQIKLTVSIRYFSCFIKKKTSLFVLLTFFIGLVHANIYVLQLQSLFKFLQTVTQQVS